MKREMTSFAFGVLVVALTASAFGAPLQSGYAGPVPPPTLTGEMFTGTISSLSGTCNGGNATISFESSGVATGPYAGIYNAYVTVSSIFTGSYFEQEISQPFVTAYFRATVSSITTLSETFEIRNSAGDLLVSGTKSQLISGSLLCADTFSQTTIFGTSTGLFGVYRNLYEPFLTYEASIFTPSGTYHDQGASTLLAQDIEAHSAIDFSSNTFSESFTSSLATPSLGVPTSNYDCKKDGWRDRTRADGTRFKNEGDCIQYAQTAK